MLIKDREKPFKMNHFIEANLPEYNLNNDGNKMKEKICICCLRTNVPHIKLATCEHFKLLNSLLEIKIMHLREHVICGWCHKILKDIDKFKIQTNESINILNSGVKTNLAKKTLHNLEFSKIELQSTINFQPIEHETIERTPSNESEFEIGTVVKIEQGDFSDFEHDPPSPQTNKRTVRTGESTKVNKKINKPRLQIYEGKVKIVVLSEEEMLEDRRKDALNKNYLNLPYKCEACITGFDHELNLIDHMEKRHKKKRGSRVCNICQSVLNTKLSFDEHLKRHYRRHECVECGKRYNNVYSVMKHYNEIHGRVDMSFSCKQCDFTTESHRSYRYHRDKHRTAKVECEQCGNTFVNKAGLRVHMLIVHKQSNRVYSCEPCGKVYRTKSGLSAHITHNHADTAPAYCVKCDMSFRSEWGLKHHLKTASKHISDDDKRFTCNECDIKFLTKGLLQEHIDWIHLNDTKHTCNKCSKIFKNGRNLKRHMTFVHEKKRPPRNKICDHCGRGFTSSAILRSHIRTHTGERPLQCVHCSATFAHSAALYTHNKLLHSKQNEDK